ncbi:phospholipase effector Tle1 domain-containing protein [Azohydromonas caseinilytica]|uniref:DUF2235 domain-containing protein n=1 Tax=Azohydromonas caseinilytica TaxID=2728836 RepID=A0A848FH49_9BURK|nr:DUF2235 domain-containing protein [Azohydromonas caseinilytica]NML17171.1 DUF2235 domain-containing protein [Azohydromonas caseinilytica]
MAQGAGMRKGGCNIAVFIDGTWNQAERGKLTNVHKLFARVRENTIEGREQLKIYLPGVGRKPRADIVGSKDADYEVHLARILNHEMPPGTMDWERGLWGGGLGKGTTERIKAAYHFICSNFVKKRRDRVYLFGFSRGAFAARSIAGFIDHVGLLLAEHLKYIHLAYRMYETSEDARQSSLRKFLYELTGREAAGMDGEFSIPIHFLGVWDTVASLGLPSRQNWFSAPYTEYRQVEVPPAVMCARHALALHELRGTFEPLLWKPGRHRDLKQVWFPGAHADVGGGYPAQESSYSNMVLRWMAEEACDKGLEIDLGGLEKTVSSTAHGIHHEVRGPFIGSFPVPRIWLEDAVDTRDAQAVLSTCHFHASAVEYLERIDKAMYKFRHPFVNSALRKIDALALRRFMQLRLSGQGIVGVDEKPESSSFPGNGRQTACDPWWESVSHEECKKFFNVLSNFLQNQGVPSEAECEAFARAMALHYIFRGDSAFIGAMDRIYNQVPCYDGESPSSAIYRQADAWLPRGQAVVRGLNRCVKLLQSCPTDIARVGASRFQMGVELLVQNLTHSAITRGVELSSGPRGPLRIKRGKA